MKNKLFTYTIFLVLSLSCKDDKTKYRFVNTPESGIDFVNKLTTTEDLNILNYLYFYNGAGVAAADFNNDGLIDTYFTANQGPDKLYLNRGNLDFEDITITSGIKNDFGWTTGVTTVDINNDGFLDIYISKVSGHLDLKGHNLLYVNYSKKNGPINFKEESEKYNLNYSGLYTQSVFFDYDLDGDLDVYLLGHSLYPNAYFGKGSQRKKLDSINGDKLLENINGFYHNASAKAKIFSSRIGYGLGVGISDFNKDGYPDIYVSNDFFEDDYMYINQKDGSFTEINSSQSALGHTSHFSMGNDVADIDNDGAPDLLSLDMLPEDLKTLKTSGAEYSYPIFKNQLRQGYQPQFMQNALHLNNGSGQFSEIAFLSGIAATEWSWSPLIADFDSDGNKDIYITNGILGATNDMDFINFISNEKIQKRLGSNMTNSELPLIAEIPEKKTKNYFFLNKDGFTFENVSSTWTNSSTSFSNGSTYTDLDNDGDLDILVNNVNEPAYILENKSSELNKALNYLKINFKGPTLNTFGVGAQLKVYSQGEEQFFENYTTRGYLSAIAPEITVGLGSTKKIDSLQVIWPNKTFQTLKNITTNQSITLDINNATGNYYSNYLKSKEGFNFIADTLISHRYKDNETLEFSRNPLVPYASTNLSKSVITGDINNDYLEDVIILGSKGNTTKVFKQNENGNFTEYFLSNIDDNSLNEDIDALVFDANRDKLNDVIIVSGGNEVRSGKALQPRLYINDGVKLQQQLQSLPDIELNASTVKAVDLDNDGDLDLSITSDGVPQNFGKTPEQYLLVNDGLGNYTDVTTQYSSSFKNIGNVRDIKWQDVDSNGFKDALVVGHWMAPTLFLNDGKHLKLQLENGLQDSSGWYNAIEVADFDNDGDFDIIVGNWGLNTRLKASIKEPIKLYSKDFDNNGKLDPIVSYFYKGEETTIATKDELSKQLPQLNKDYLSYSAFAKANFSELFPSEKSTSSISKNVTELASVYFENLGNNTFIKKQLPLLAQVSSVHDILIEDFNEDGYKDALLVGNDYEISTQLGRLDGSKGILLINNKKGFFDVAKRSKINILGASRSIQKLTISGKEYYVVGRNNDLPLFLRKED